MKLSRLIEAMAENGISAGQIAAICKTLETSQSEVRKARNKRYRETQKTSQDAKDAKGSNGSNDNITLTSLPPKTKPTLRSGLERARARTRLGEVETKFNLDFARQAGMDSRQIDIEFDQFCDHHRKHGSLMADWQAAWRTWVRNAIKFQARAGPAGRSNGVRGFLENVAQMMANGNDGRTESGNGGSHQGVLGLPERRG